VTQQKGAYTADTRNWRRWRHWSRKTEIDVLHGNMLEPYGQD